MALFKGLLNFKSGALARLLDKRKAARCAVGPGFPARGSVNLAGSESLARLASHKIGSGYNWSGRLHNLSASGVSLQLPPAAVSVRGEKTVLTVSLEEHRLQFPCTVAHFRVHPHFALCGLALEFPEAAARTAYLQLLESVAIGASVSALKPGGGRPPGLVQERYRADHGGRIFAWREGRDGDYRRFEFVFGEQAVAGEPAAADLRQLGRGRRQDGVEGAWSDPALVPVARGDGEIRRLFRWVVPNIPPKAVPSGLRRLLDKFATAPVARK